VSIQEDARQLTHYKADPILAEAIIRLAREADPSNIDDIAKVVLLALKLVLNATGQAETTHGEPFDIAVSALALAHPATGFGHTWGKEYAKRLTGRLNGNQWCKCTSEADYEDDDGEPIWYICHTLALRPAGERTIQRLLDPTSAIRPTKKPRRQRKKLKFSDYWLPSWHRKTDRKTVIAYWRTKVPPRSVFRWFPVRAFESGVTVEQAQQIARDHKLI
jgi:hypothetical protein